MSEDLRMASCCDGRGQVRRSEVCAKNWKNLQDSARSPRDTKTMRSDWRNDHGAA
ncbi:MAG: hypothetical protein KME47_22820 [Nodosilinea sp. WJT8-NPBG4]|nr:hypothetical protein [Nodosilinea sp. WJT8-NPBG4]